ncbi:extracellular solute-binding protein [Cutibacterium avidum]|uniref:extracellular solute-binding protein n=1 Tax=Cutibacterium avidum TaxID=33010 RepID=UPI000AA5D323|nr:extracellular solute-binding protein [Cutibacterium avidum]MDK7698022.1 extracellular solute-binding protein [Cutibacterium avidum]MDU6251107.1 extracellular solute-binding protein [Cutibacterium avidum]
MIENLTRRGFLSGTVTAGAIVGLTACGGGKSAGGTASDQASGSGGKTYDGPKVELTFWNGFTGGDGTFMKKLVNKFNSSHDNIKVTMQSMQWADLYKKLPTAVTAGKAPDVAVIHLDSVATMAARKSIQPLDDVAKALDLKGSDFAKVPWVAGIYRDVRYSIPPDVHPMGMFFNKTVMDKAGLDPNKPPQTQGDYMSALETLKSKGVAGHWASPFQFTIPTQRNGNSNRVDAAKVFVNWVSQQSLEWAKGGQIPARNSVRESDGFAKLTGQSTLAKQINDVVFPPNRPWHQ